MERQQKKAAYRKEYTQVPLPLASDVLQTDLVYLATDLQNNV